PIVPAQSDPARARCTRRQRSLHHFCRRSDRGSGSALVAPYNPCMHEVPADTAAEILVVDDDPDVRTFVRAVLESDGHRVVEAGSGQDAIQRLRIRRPALVLLDVMMPAMDGFAAVHAIKREPGPFVPVILLTALDDPASRAKGINAGADEILAKPVHPFELRLRCRAMLRIHQLTEELHAANRRLRALARTDELTEVRD